MTEQNDLSGVKAETWPSFSPRVMTIIALAPLLFLLFCRWLVYTQRFFAWASEDHVLENIQVLLLLAGATGSILIWRRIGQACSSPSARMWWAGMAVFLSIVLMEEISWGQRIFDFETPPWLQKASFQREINVHNIYEIQKQTGNTLFGIAGGGVILAVLAASALRGRPFYRHIVTSPALFFYFLPAIIYFSYNWRNIMGEFSRSQRQLNRLLVSRWQVPVELLVYAGLMLGTLIVLRRLTLGAIPASPAPGERNRRQECPLRPGGCR